MTDQPETTERLFKDELREWRGKRLQKEAAATLGVPRGTLRTWEYGKRTPTKITLEAIRRRMMENPYKETKSTE